MNILSKNKLIYIYNSKYVYIFFVILLKCVLLNKMRDWVVVKCLVCIFGECVVRCFIVNLLKFIVYRWIIVIRELFYLIENKWKMEKLFNFVFFYYKCD